MLVSLKKITIYVIFAKLWYHLYILCIVDIIEKDNYSLLHLKLANIHTYSLIKMIKIHFHNLHTLAQ